MHLLYLCEFIWTFLNGCISYNLNSDQNDDLIPGRNNSILRNLRNEYFQNSWKSLLHVFSCRVRLLNTGNIQVKNMRLWLMMVTFFQLTEFLMGRTMLIVQVRSAWDTYWSSQQPWGKDILNSYFETEWFQKNRDPWHPWLPQGLEGTKLSLVTVRTRVWFYWGLRAPK